MMFFSRSTVLFSRPGPKTQNYSMRLCWGIALVAALAPRAWGYDLDAYCYATEDDMHNFRSWTATTFYVADSYCINMGGFWIHKDALDPKAQLYAGEPPLLYFQVFAVTVLFTQNAQRLRLSMQCCSKRNGG
jgi:hypothetical protein